MALVNGGYLHFLDIEKFLKILLRNYQNKIKKIGFGPLKNSDEPSRAILALLFNPLPDDKILDWSKLKQITDNILNCI